MFRNFEDSLYKFIADRVDEIGRKFVIQNKKYKELANTSIQVHCQIRNNLPEHLTGLIGEYETINASMQCISEEIIYKQGLLDGIRVKRIVQSLHL
jgi:hypothetical protein